MEREAVPAATPAPERALGGASAVVRLVRPAQWTKNVFVLAGLVFGRHFLQPADLARAGLAFAAFCLLSSAVYCLNDVVDRRADSLHPLKRRRPVASGAVAPASALALGLALAAAGSAALAVLGHDAVVLGDGYLALNVAYSLLLKRVALWDALAVAGGFVLRTVAGAEVVAVAASPWLLVCTYLVTLYVSLGKRWADAVETPPLARTYAGSAEEYDAASMRLFMQVAMSATLISYALYAVEGTYGPWMLLTLPFVIYGLFRYQHLVEHRGLGGAPDTAVLVDPPFVANAVAFAALAVAVVLWAPR